MPATPRSRTHNPLVPGGTWGSTTQTYRPVVNTCIDVVGDFGGMHSLNIEKLHKKPRGVNGKVSAWPAPDKVLSNWVPLRFSSSEGINHLNIARQYDDASGTLKALASSNPNRPVVSLPVFIAELKDIPKMIKQAGDILLGRNARATATRTVAEGYLAASFGWLPLFDDLNKLFHFQDLVEKKKKELDHLYQNGGIRRKRVLQNDSASLTDGPWSMNSNGGLSVMATCHRTTTYEEWVTVRWNLIGSSRPKPTDTEIRNQAANIVRGTILDPRNIAADLWNIVPWSWLTDWFVNIGDYLDSHRGGIPVEPTRTCVMKRTHTVGVYTRTSGTINTTGGDGTIDRWTKLRLPTSPTPGLSASIPFLTGHQASILGSLFITRVVRN